MKHLDAFGSAVNASIFTCISSSPSRVHCLSYPIFFPTISLEHTDTDCHMTRLGGRRNETQSMLTARTVRGKKLGRLVS